MLPYPNNTTIPPDTSSHEEPFDNIKPDVVILLMLSFSDWGGTFFNRIEKSLSINDYLFTQYKRFRDS